MECMSDKKDLPKRPSTPMTWFLATCDEEGTWQKNEEQDRQAILSSACTVYLEDHPS